MGTFENPLQDVINKNYESALQKLDIFADFAGSEYLQFKVDPSKAMVERLVEALKMDQQYAKRNFPNLRKQYDEFNKISAYRDSRSPFYINTPGFFCYFTMRDSQEVPSSYS